jgi:hypothetical protein
VLGLTLGHSFSLNAWVKSYDVDRGTLFSISNEDCTHREDEITAFTWRVSNNPPTHTRKRHMIAVEDTSSTSPVFAL